MKDDEWVKSAMSNDAQVAELLLRLKHAQTVTAANPNVMLPLRWGIRQRRSRSSRIGGCSTRKEADSSRFSPTTPLSWSGGSASAGEATVDGCDETTSVGSRSKVLAPNDVTCARSKRLKRKKTFSELKDIENDLLKERLHLKKEMATLQAAFKEQTARNENLKRIKLDFTSRHDKNTTTVDSVKINSDSGPNQERKPSSFVKIPSATLRHRTKVDFRISDPRRTDKAAASRVGIFFLPDLNMSATEDDSVAEPRFVKS